MTRLFTADYSTGDFSQWPTVQNIHFLGPPGSLYPSIGPNYPLTLVSLGDGGFCGRFEVRTGDTPVAQPSGERSETGELSGALTPTETTRWYAFSTKFDTTFPTNHGTLGWADINQWHSDSVDSNPTVLFGFMGSTPDGYFSLVHIPQSSPLVQIGVYRVLDLPLDRGNWHDIKMQVYWSTSDASGYVRVWYDGVRQTFLSGVGGGQTYAGRTVVPGDTSVHYHEGYYRENGIAPTGIIYHKDFRIADSEDSL